MTEESTVRNLRGILGTELGQLRHLNVTLYHFTSVVKNRPVNQKGAPHVWEILVVKVQV